MTEIKMEVKEIGFTVNQQWRIGKATDTILLESSKDNPNKLIIQLKLKEIKEIIDENNK